MYNYQVLSYRPVDGDTTELVIDLGFKLTITQLCRFSGIDAPEHTTLAGQLVAKVVEKWLAKNIPLVVTSVSRDKYADRFDGVITGSALGSATMSVNNYLIANHLARPYAGGLKLPWSASELANIVTIANSILAV